MRTRLIYNLDELNSSSSETVGGKARSLGYLIINGIKVPKGSVITGDVYDMFVDETGLRGRILIELSRKSFEDMRWEEIWDASQRIRNMFNTTEIPPEIKSPLSKKLSRYNGLKTAVRSSSIAEDSSSFSFAGLHESYLNIQNVNEIISKTKLVWASLWSDSSLLYRKELGLSIEDSKMPVIVQEMIFGDASGVTFTVNPNNDRELLIEAVYGLCKGLVDGIIEPDRWRVDRDNFQIISHEEPNREKAVRPSSQGVIEVGLNEMQKTNPPLTDIQVKKLAKLAYKIEEVFGSPQDIEWTIKDNYLYIIQARPITTVKDNGDIRQWYLSLRRSIKNLTDLEYKISNKILPEMISEANNREDIMLKNLDNSELIEEINHRSERLKHWHKVYWDVFIPMAHGARLFGQIYNDNVKPEDPYEFMILLSGMDMISIRRNNRINEISKILKQNPDLINSLTGECTESTLVNDLRKEIRQLFGNYSSDLGTIINLLTKIDENKERNEKNIEKFLKKYLNSFPETEKELAEEALRIGRKSWKLRDDDNIILGKFEKLLSDALEEAKKRLINIGLEDVNDLIEDEIVLSLSLNQKIETKILKNKEYTEKFVPRQLVGQPASPGLVTGSARVIIDQKDLFDFKEGEILVVDSIDPNMTFIVPLAAGIIERRGGMLIHGAIISREYGVPCVTGIPDATNIIKTGEMITVDGYLGIIIIEKK